MTEKKKRGAPKGNQNARTHGFYSQVLDEVGMVRTRYSISAGQKRSLKDAITKALTEIAVPLGIKALIK